MRSFLAWPMVLAAALLAGLTLQQMQLGHLRRQLTQQGAALQESQDHISALTGQLAQADAARAATRGPLRRAGAETAFWREDERRLMLSSYAGFLAQANLPPSRMARLKDLLVERAEALADAQDAANQEGIAVGTSEMTQATALATEDIDREIAGLLGPAPGFRLPEAEPVAYAAPAPAVSSSPVYLSAESETPNYTYLPAVAAPAPAPEPAVAAESPAVEYVPVADVLYVVRRDGRFAEHSRLPDRRFIGGPRPPEGRPPLERPGQRFPVRTAPVH